MGQREGEGWQLTSWVLHILVVLAGLKVGEGGVAGRGEGHHLEHQGGGGGGEGGLTLGKETTMQHTRTYTYLQPPMTCC